MTLTSMGQVAAARVPAFLTKFDVPVYKLTDSNGKKNVFIHLLHEQLGLKYTLVFG